MRWTDSGPAPRGRNSTTSSNTTTGDAALDPGELVAFTSDSKLYLTTVDGLEPDLLSGTLVEGARIGEWGFSPGGTHIAFVADSTASGEDELHVVDIRTRTTRPDFTTRVPGQHRLVAR